MSHAFGASVRYGYDRPLGSVNNRMIKRISEDERPKATPASVESRPLRLHPSLGSQDTKISVTISQISTKWRHRWAGVDQGQGRPTALEKHLQRSVDAIQSEENADNGLHIYSR